MLKALFLERETLLTPDSESLQMVCMEVVYCHIHITTAVK